MLNTMTKYQSLIIYGLFMVFTGVYLILFQYKSSDFFQFAVALGMIISSAFALITAYKSKHMQVRFRYHELHAAGMLVYSIAVLFFSATVEKFLNITSFFLIYYGMAEMIFCFWLFNLKSKLNFKVLMVRLVVGFSIYMGAVVILILSGTNGPLELMWYGVLFITIGIHVILYKPIMKTFEVPIISLV